MLRVKSGHRMTLAYNLYVSEHVGRMVEKEHPTADPTSYPLYASVKALVEQPGFMRSGVEFPISLIPIIWLLTFSLLPKLLLSPLLFSP